MTTLALPVLMFHLALRPGAAPPALARSLAAFTTDLSQVEQRLGWALRGLAPGA